MKKGESASKVVYWKVIERRLVEDADESGVSDDDEEQKERIPLLRYYNVFNLDQITGLTVEDLGFEVLDRPDVLEADDLTLFHQLRDALDADIQLGGAQAAYNHRTDVTRLPDPDRFTTVYRFYATLFHKLVHWLGHPDRLDWDMAKTVHDPAHTPGKS